MRIEQELAYLIKPVTSLDGLVEVMEELGYPLPRPGDLLPPEIANFIDAAKALMDDMLVLASGLADGTPGDTVLADSLSVVSKVRQIMVLVSNLRASENLGLTMPLPWSQPGILADLGREIPGYLLTKWVRERHPLAHEITALLGLWRSIAPVADLALPDGIADPNDIEQTTEAAARAARVVYGLDLDQLNRYVTEPGPALLDLVTEGDRIDLTRLVITAQNIARHLGLRPPSRSVLYIDDEWIEQEIDDPSGNLFGIQLLPPALDDVFDLGLSFDHDDGAVVLGLDIAGAESAEHAFDDDWRLVAGLTGQGGVSFRYHPTSGFEVTPGQVSSAGHAALIGLPETPWRILGFGEGARLTLDGIEARIEASLTGNDPELEVNLDMHGLRLTVDLSESDSFLATLLPIDTVEVAFGAALRWSSRDGLNITGNGPSDITIPVNLVLGPIQIPTVSIGFMPEDGSLRILFTLSAGAELGIMRASVDGVGACLELTATAQDDGLLGAYELGFAFKPPRGIGFGIGTPGGPISGGGYLDINHAAGEYAGLLNIKVAGVDITAIAIIDTQALEGGGWSMFFALFIGIPAITLPFGFTLEGVGGVAGINRTLVPEALLEAVRSGTVDTVLFPENPVQDAPVIINTFRTIFPPAEGRTVFGPVVKIGWAKGVAKLELGVVIELPDPIKIAVLGSLKITMPPLPAPGAGEDASPAPTQPDGTGDTPAEPLSIINLRLDMAGIFDFGEGTVAIDAYLHDSTIAGFPLSGGASMRAGFKGNKSFLLAIGGFHPGFPQPQGFPIVPRLGMSLEIAEVIQISFESYFAVASNTVQFGASFQLRADVAIFAIEGGFAFDALIETNPLRVDFALAMYVSVRAVGIDLMAVRMAGTVIGPKPWVIDAVAEVNLLGYRDGVEIHYSTEEVDSTPPLPPIDVLVLLIEALAEPSAWQAEAPAADGVLVTEPSRDNLRPRIAPDATLTLGQTLAPFDTDVDRHGRNENVFYTRFSLDLLGLDPNVVSPASDWFAPGMFRDLGASDQARLSAPSFEEMPAGQRISAGIKTAPARAAELTHKTIRLDPVIGIDPATLPAPSEVPVADRLDSDTQGVLSHTPTVVAVVSDLGPVDVLPPLYVSVSTSDGTMLSASADTYMNATAAVGLSGAALVRDFEERLLT